MIIFKIDTDDLRNLCIRHNYYTRGDNKAYANIFEMAKYNEEGDLIAVARDILDHSDTNDTLEEVAEYILNNCCYMSVSIEE